MVILLPKNSKAPFTGSNSRPNSMLPTLSKLLGNIVFDQIQCYFTVNKLTNFQHAYREGYSTSTALTQMTDDWLREIDDKKIVGAVLLGFSAVIVCCCVLGTGCCSFTFSTISVMHLSTVLADTGMSFIFEMIVSVRQSI